MINKTFAMALAGAVGVTGLAPTSLVAAPAEAPARSLEQVRAGALAAMNAGDLQQVQKRGGKRFRGSRAGKRSFRGGRSFRGSRNFRGRTVYRRGYSGGRRYYGGRSYRRGYGGAAVAAGVIGLAAGAAIASGGSGYRTRSWCAERYRSYNPRTGTYLGYDGLRHRCP